MTARITAEQLDLLDQIADLVERVCGSHNELVECTCLDEDDDAPHANDCAWNVVRPVLEALSEVPGYMPEKAAGCLVYARAIICEARDALGRVPEQIILVRYSARGPIHEAREYHPECYPCEGSGGARCLSHNGGIHEICCPFCGGSGHDKREALALVCTGRNVSQAVMLASGVESITCRRCLRVRARELARGGDGQ